MLCCGGLVGQSGLLQQFVYFYELQVLYSRNEISGNWLAWLPWRGTMLLGVM